MCVCVSVCIGMSSIVLRVERYLVRDAVMYPSLSGVGAPKVTVIFPHSYPQAFSCSRSLPLSLSLNYVYIPLLNVEGSSEAGQGEDRQDTELLLWNDWFWCTDNFYYNHETLHHVWGVLSYFVFFQIFIFASGPMILNLKIQGFSLLLSWSASPSFSEKIKTDCSAVQRKEVVAVTCSNWSGKEVRNPLIFITFSHPGFVECDIYAWELEIRRWIWESACPLEVQSLLKIVDPGMAG